MQISRSQVAVLYPPPFALHLILRDATFEVSDGQMFVVGTPSNNANVGQGTHKVEYSPKVDKWQAFLSGIFEPIHSSTQVIIQQGHVYAVVNDSWVYGQRGM